MTRTAIVGLSLIASLATAELGTRLLLPRPDFESVPEHPSIVPHPTRGFSYAPNYPGFTNSLGMRDAPLGGDESVDVLAVGDSFTVGGGLKAEEAWPQQLQALLNSASPGQRPVRVLNGGVAAYSAAQIRVTAGELVVSLKPKAIVIGLLTSRYWRIGNPYVYFHGVAVLTSDLPHLRAIDGGLVRSPFNPGWMQSLDFFLAEHCYFGAYLSRAARSLVPATTADAASPSAPLADRLQPLLDEVERVRHIAAAAGSQLVVLLINEQSPNGTFDPVEADYNAVVRAFCERLGISIVEPLPVLEKRAGGKPIFRQGADYHWSAQAQHVAAEQLAAFFSSSEKRWRND